MTAEEFIEKVKTALGELLPSDLIFEIKGNEIHFYNESTPDKNTIMLFEENSIEKVYESIFSSYTF